MKRYFSCLLVLFLFILTSEGLVAQKANPPSDFDYDLNKAGTGVIIQKYKGEATDVIVPSSIEDFPVVELDGEAFYKSSIVSVVIPDSVIWIRNGYHDGYNYVRGCFSYCESLQKVTLQKNLKYIPPCCFEGCSSLKEITLPKELEIIESYAFCNSGLESITIPDSVILIDYYAFAECKNLKTVSIGNGVKIINYGAFENCSALITVTVGNGIKGINDKAFSGCSSLKSFNIGVEKIDSGERIYINNDHYSFGYADNAFSGCSSLSLKERKKIRDTGYKGGF